MNKVLLRKNLSFCLPRRAISSFKNIPFKKSSFKFILPFLLASSAVILVYETKKSDCNQNLPHQVGLPFLSPYFIADIVEQVSPSVVNILNYTKYGEAGVGSGFVISSDGYIVTNTHVVMNARNKTVLINFSDGIYRKAAVHSFDKDSDIALLKIISEKDESFPAVRIGSSAKTRPGEFVVAIGSPVTLQNSASLGIVSALARHASELGISNNRSEYIQTDAAINQGNSGGPLINCHGEVIGINSLKLGGLGVDGINFAIPIDVAMQIIQQLKKNRKVTRPFVGLKMANVRSKNKDKGSDGPFPIDLNTQLIVLEVVRGSPAEKCGIQPGDIILEVNGKPARLVRDVFDEIGYEVGRKITFKLKRNQSELELTLHTAPEVDRR